MSSDQHRVSRQLFASRCSLSLSRTQTHRRVVDRLNLRIDLRVRLTHASRQIHLQINNVAPHRRHSDGARAASKRERDPADQGGADSHRCLAWGLHGAHLDEKRTVDGFKLL